jgi:hypothetical protein
LCKEANFSQERLATPDEMVSATVVERVWQAAIVRVGDPELGLHIGEALHPTALGLIDSSCSVARRSAARSTS